MVRQNSQVHQEHPVHEPRCSPQLQALVIAVQQVRERYACWTRCLFQLSSHECMAELMPLIA